MFGLFFLLPVVIHLVFVLITNDLMCMILNRRILSTAGQGRAITPRSILSKSLGPIDSYLDDKSFFDSGVPFQLLDARGNSAVDAQWDRDLEALAGEVLNGNENEAAALVS